jgi:hypothetical protein
MSRHKLLTWRCHNRPQLARETDKGDDIVPSFGDDSVNHVDVVRRRCRRLAHVFVGICGRRQK